MTIAHADDGPESHMPSYPTPTAALFTALRLTAPEVYARCCAIVCSEKRFFSSGVLCALPSLDMLLVLSMLRDYSWDAVDGLIACSPEILAPLVAGFHAGTLKVTRCGFLEHMVPRAGLFCYYIFEMNLSDEELAYLCSASSVFMQCKQRIYAVHFRGVGHHGLQDAGLSVSRNSL